MMWDYIVIGAGSAGCALTRELVNAGSRVLVIEAGGSDRSLMIKIPAAELIAAEKFDWGYHAEPDPSRQGFRQPWTRGKVLGGSSSINGMIFVRGADGDFDRWADHCGGAGSWSARDVLPIFRDIETSDQPSSRRGRSGRLSVRTVRRPHAVTKAFIESAAAVGLPFNEDYNGASQEGVSYIQYTQRRGLRCSAADAFLKPLLRKKNLSLFLNARVDRIKIQDGCARTVIFQRRGREHEETARDIVVCAGAMNSPKLLMLSGIGDRKELVRHGIECLLDLPAVGQHLQDHPSIYLGYRTRVPTYTPTGGLFKKLGILAKFIAYGEGPISNPFEGMGFFKSSPTRTRPNLQLFFSSLGYLRSPDGSFRIAPYPALMMSAANSYPVSSGQIRLASASPAAAPVIDIALLRERADVEAMIEGIEAIRRIVDKAPLSGIIENEIAPGRNIRSYSELESFVRAGTTICYHSIGTCRMGVGKDTVVSPDLLVHGTKNLWVADASIIPLPISGNMNASCIMIGSKLGRQLVGRHGS